MNKWSNKTAAVVVLYQPPLRAIHNIMTYANDVDIVYAIDNSDKKNLEFMQKIITYKNIKYIDNHGNKGIAHALNLGIHQAISEGFEWVLTMDQDSRATENMLSKLYQYLENNYDKQLGIVTAFQETEVDKAKYHPREYERVNWTICSGNLLQITAYQSCGGFMEELFIDSVDFEYSMRLKINDFFIIRLNRAVLLHQLGSTKRIHNRKVIIHSGSRMYYRIRNAFYIHKIYESSCRQLADEIFSFSIESCRNDLRYAQCKPKYLFYMLKGYIDFRLKRMGKIHKN